MKSRFKNRLNCSFPRAGTTDQGSSLICSLQRYDCLFLKKYSKYIQIQQVSLYNHFYNSVKTCLLNIFLRIHSKLINQKVLCSNTSINLLRCPQTRCGTLFSLSVPINKIVVIYTILKKHSHTKAKINTLMVFKMPFCLFLNNFLSILNIAFKRCFIFLV